MLVPQCLRTATLSAFARGRQRPDVRAAFSKIGVIHRSQMSGTCCLPHQTGESSLGALSRIG
jgi:hypothetical protein